MRRADRMRTALLAGWLFADLFLVLVLVGLASLPVTTEDAAPTSTPEPTVTAEPPERDRLEKLPVGFAVEIPPARFRDAGRRAAATRELLRRIDAELKARDLTGRRAGFVLAFASGPEPGAAQRTAEVVYQDLRRRHKVFRDSSGLGYWTGAGDHLEFKIFFFE
ncbi:hypothetical protein [Nonomuraea africana]|uniref:Uncharacterized protein n=1 Tax=Nonomuraea africana TaxID=46171 RepID=A0ABR9KFZ4_9ACTN|nr:hypothetical protein [Nonomuraea africana]MBE1560745.1 hypothetical protein [Nonomuraea africana]